MAVYNIKNDKSPIESVEFTPVSDGNFSFYYLKDATHQNDVRTMLTKDFEQEVVAETSLNNKPVIITHGERTRDQMLKILEEKGHEPKLKVHEDGINWWGIRGSLSMLGQALNFISASYGLEKVKEGSELLNAANPKFNPKLKAGMYVHKGISTDVGAFAVLNIAANCINMLYGGQKEEATNQLHAIKHDLNENLNTHITTHERTFDVRDHRAALHEDIKKPKTTLEKANDVMAKNSVRLGEIGLRYLCAIALVFPLGKMRAGFNALRQGEGMAAAYNVAKNPNKLVMASGLAYLTGKTMSAFSKVPDPYDTTEKSTVDKIREDYLFKVASLVEAGAAGTLSYSAIKSKKIGFKNEPGSPGIIPHTDYVGGLAGVVLTGGLLARSKAAFGTKNLDTEEVFAHATDTLAKTAPEKLPQLMADSSATVKEHLKDSPVEYGEIFTKMMSDMYRYHHIALDNVGKEPDKFIQPFVPKDPYPDQPPVGRHLFARDAEQRTAADIAAAAQPASHAEKARKSQESSPTLAV